MQTALTILIVFACIALGLPILAFLLRVTLFLILLFVSLWEGK